jgi:hypothetical protein
MGLKYPAVFRNCAKNALPVPQKYKQGEPAGKPHFKILCRYMYLVPAGKFGTPCALIKRRYSESGSIVWGLILTRYAKLLSL